MLVSAATGAQPSRAPILLPETTRECIYAKGIAAQEPFRSLRGGENGREIDVVVAIHFSP